MLVRWLRFLLCSFFLVTLSGCPASPPAGIPAPVSELLSVGNPDANGNVQLTGAPGAVNGGATVGGTPLPQASNRFLQKLILPTVHAGEILFDSTTANPDGSFNLEIQAQVGDVIEVTQTVEGETSPPTAIVVAGDTVNLGFDGQDLEVDENTGLIYASAVNEMGMIFRLNFLSGDPLSEPTPFCNSLDNGLTALALDVPNAMGYVISPSSNNLYSFGLSGVCDPSTIPLPNKPLDVTANPVSPGVVISMEAPGGVPSLMSFPNMGTPPACNIAIVHPGKITHVATTLLATGPSPFIFSISEFADGSLWATRLDLERCNSPAPAEILLPAGILPGGLTAVNSNRALLSDANSNRVLELDFINQNVSGEVTVGKNPEGIAVDSQTNRAYVVNLGDNSISILDLSNFSLLSTIPSVGLMPNDIGLIPGGNSAAVLSTFDDAVVLTDITP